jgi:hypothetical protein
MIYICRHDADKYTTQNRQCKYLNKVISKKALIKLSKDLPYGSSTTIRTRLMKKYPDKEPYTIDYIRRVLDPDDPRKNTLIIEEAIAYRNELLAAEDDLNDKVFHPEI